MGTNTKTPATRARVSKKPSSVAVDRTRSPRIAAEVSQDRNRIGGHLGEHPGKGEQECPEKRDQPRDGGKACVLNRGDDLDEAHNNSRDETDNEQRSAQPEGRHQALPQDLNYK